MMGNTAGAVVGVVFCSLSLCHVGTSEAIRCIAAKPGAYTPNRILLKALLISYLRRQSALRVPSGIASIA